MPLDLLSDQGLRLDGRRPDELRNIRCKLGVFNQPDGSAYLEQGNTKILAAVYGPHEVSGKNRPNNESVIVNCQYSMATFSTGERKNRPRGDRKSTEMSIHLKAALSAAIRVELYPRSQIDVYIEVLQADGGQFCAAVNAAVLALIDAGIPLKEYVCACTASMATGYENDVSEDASGGPVALVDVSHVEESSGGPCLTVVALAGSGMVVLLDMSQRLHADYLEMAVKRAIQGCKDIQGILDDAVRQHISRVVTGSFPT